MRSALRSCGWAAAEYAHDPIEDHYIKTRNFVGQGEFFEPHESFRYFSPDRSDNDEVIYTNLCFLGPAFARDYRRILLADALFMNSDRHMRNFGVIRSAKDGETLRMAPNFDNNQAYKSNIGVKNSAEMLSLFEKAFGLTEQDCVDLRALAHACSGIAYLKEAQEVVNQFLA